MSRGLQVEETPVMDVIESATPVIVKRYLSTLSVNQRVSVYTNYINLQGCKDGTLYAHAQQ